MTRNNDPHPFAPRKDMDGLPWQPPERAGPAFAAQFAAYCRRRNQQSPRMSPSARTNPDNIHEELLALLDEEKCYSAQSSRRPPPPPRKIDDGPPSTAKRRNGGGPRCPFRGGGERSVPPTFKDWARDAGGAVGAATNGTKKGPGSSDGGGKGGRGSTNGSRGNGSRGGRSGRSSRDSSRGGRSRKSSSATPPSIPVVMQNLALVFVGVCFFVYNKNRSSSRSSSDGGSRERNRIQSRIHSFLLRHGASDREGRTAPRAQFNFIDSAWRGREEVQFETLIPPSEIDFAIQRRLRAEEEGNCDDVLLYLPRTSPRGGGHGIELNGYLLAALLATYTGKAMVVLEAPTVPAGGEEEGSEAGDGGSSSSSSSGSPRAATWYDCPVDTFRNVIAEDGGKEEEEGRGGGGGGRRGRKRRRDRAPKDEEANNFPGEEDFPQGLSRVIQHPAWLSRGCPVPCQSSYDFFKWNDLRRQHIQQVTCQNDNDRQAVVFAVDGEDARRYFESQWREQMLERPSSRGKFSTAAYEWAIRLGAKGNEARTFAGLREEGDVWDYVSALMARSGVVRFQPWIARDVKAMIKSSELPMNWPYVAIYVHRDGPSRTESKGSDEDGPEEGGGEERPAEFVPFVDYLRQWEGADCDTGEPHPVYVATNDPRRIREEIDRLPKDSGGNAVVGECHKLRFVFSPVEKSVHLLDEDVEHDCAALHRANVAAIADLMISAKSDTFVGGGRDSNFGRLVRIFRTAVNNFPRRGGDGPVLVRNARFATGAGAGGTGAPGT